MLSVTPLVWGTPVTPHSFVTFGGAGSGFVLKPGSSLVVSEGSSISLSQGVIRDEGGHIVGNVSCSSMHYERPADDFVGTVTGTLGGDANLTLANGQQCIISAGTVSRAIAVASGEAVVKGDGSLGGMITVAAGAELVCGLTAPLTEDILLQASTSSLTLDADLICSSAGTVRGATDVSARVDTNGHMLIFEDAQPLVLDAPLTFSSDDTSILFRSDVVLQAQWSFKGASASIDLGGGVLDVSSAHACFSTIETGGRKIIIQNGTIANVSGSLFTHFESSSGVEFHNVNLVLAGDLTIPKGNLTFSGDCRILGTARRTFTYSSAGTLTIARGSSLTFGSEMTYIHSGATHNLVFADVTSKLVLRGGVLRATAAGAGLVLANGLIEIDHISTFDGSFVVHDDTLTFFVMPGASIVTTNGGIDFVLPS